MINYNKLDHTVWKIFEKKIKKFSLNLNVVDVGARNGMFLLPEEYSKLSHLIGFEPNKIEYEKLSKSKMDSLKSSQKVEFKKEIFHNLALWNKKCTKDFFLTKGPGASTLMGKTNNLTELMFLHNSTNSYKQDPTEIIRKTKVKCDLLDNLMPDEIVDFLKIDTEGSELNILEGAKRLLKNKNILMIKSEFVLFKYYNNHKLLGDLHLYLDKLGYRLICLDQEQPRYSPILDQVPNQNDKGLSYAGDAYFVLDFAKTKLDKLKTLRLAAISFALGFNNLGLYYVNQSTLFEKNERIKILKSLQRVSLLRALSDLWKKFPSVIYNFIKK